jgi:nitroreductase
MNEDKSNIHGNIFSESGQKEGRDYPNETMRLLLERATCRSFSDEKIPTDVMRVILEAGVHSPTGGNLQPYSIIKIESAQTRKRLALICENQDWIARAPVSLLFCVDLHRLERWAGLEKAPFTAMNSFRHFWIAFQDVVIAAQNICTASDAMGLGSVYIGSVLECFRELRELFSLPRGVFPIVLLCLGYPKHRPGPARKLGVDIVVHDEKYHEFDDALLMEGFNRKYSAWKMEITEQRLEKITAVCESVGGKRLARNCIDRIRETGHIGPAHIYFGLHYCADEMPCGNEEFLKVMEESGFGWFREYEPPNEEAD